MNEERWDILLQGWIDESLSDDELTEFELHIQAYPDRGNEAQALKNTVLLLQDMPVLDVPGDFRSNIMHRIQETPAEKIQVITIKSSRKARLLTQRNMLAVAAAFLVVFISFTSILPQVIPGITGFLPPIFRAMSADNGEDIGITGKENEPDPDSQTPVSPGAGEERGPVRNYSSLAEAGTGKMEYFPRMGPYEKKLDLIHGETPAQEILMQVPYRWVSYKVEDLEKALADTRTLFRDLDGWLEQVAEIHVDSKPVRLNVTAYIPVQDFSTAMQRLNKIGFVYDSEETLYDRSREYKTISKMIEQLETEIRNEETKMESEKDPVQKEMHRTNINHNRTTLLLWEASRVQITMGLVEISLIQAQ